MFGALLSRVPDPFTLMGVFHFLYIAMMALSVGETFDAIVTGVTVHGTFVRVLKPAVEGLDSTAHRDGRDPLQFDGSCLAVWRTLPHN